MHRTPIFVVQGAEEGEAMCNNRKKAAEESRFIDEGRNVMICLVGLDFDEITYIPFIWPYRQIRFVHGQNLTWSVCTCP
jgi:hypothetical protein